jgi:putative RecB family exonuclease
MPAYSNSSLGTFEECPLKYRFAYVDRIRIPEEGIEAFLGSRFHEVMEKLYRELPYKKSTLDELLAYFDALWDKEFHEDVTIVNPDKTAEDYKKLGRKFIEDYYSHYDPFDESRVLGLERRFSVDLDGTGRYLIKGVIDRLAQAPDGTYEIHDYKTSSSLPEQKKMGEDRQLALYQIGVENMWNDVRAVRLVWHFVAFDKELTSERTPDELERVKADVKRLIDEIESRPPDGFEPQESALCDWCGFWAICPLKKHLAKVEGLPPNEYLKEAGVKLVNKYAELDAEKKKLKGQIESIEAEMDEIKDAAIAYSKREGAKVLKGSGHLLKISDKQQISSPGKGSKERAELEKIMREAGVWDDVAGLDPYAVARAVNEKKWDAALVERIMPFLTVEKKYAVTLSEIKEEER